MCYIEGGTPLGSRKRNPGCRDSTLPRAIQPVLLDFEIFFAGHFAGWGGGAAFIRESSTDSKTLGRMYLITEEQFNDVVLQENGRIVDGTRIVPEVERLGREREYPIRELRTYSRLLRVGERDGCSILTFTSGKEHRMPAAPPSEPYVRIIAMGLRQAYPAMPDDEIVQYFMQADGVSGRLEHDQVSRWIGSRI